MQIPYKEIIKAIEDRMFSASHEEQICLDFALEVMYKTNPKKTFNFHEHTDLILKEKVTLIFSSTEIGEHEFLNKKHLWERVPAFFVVFILGAFWGLPEKDGDGYCLHI